MAAGAESKHAACATRLFVAHESPSGQVRPGRGRPSWHLLGTGRWWLGWGWGWGWGCGCDPPQLQPADNTLRDTATDGDTAIEKGEEGGRGAGAGCFMGVQG